MPFAPPFDIYDLPADAPAGEMQRLIVAALAEVVPAAVAGDQRTYSVHVDGDHDWGMTLRAFNLVRTRYGYIPFPDAETLVAAQASWHP